MNGNMPDTTEYLTADSGKRIFGSFSSTSTDTKAGSERSLGKSQGSTSELIDSLDDATQERILLLAEHFASSHGLEEHKDMIKKGALVVKSGGAFENIELLSEGDKQALRYERTHPWSQPWKMYYLVVVCSLAAALQGMDESVINGANLFFPGQFGINPAVSSRNSWLLGLVNAAPYLCCALIGCWLTAPLNARLGRRGTIFVTALLSFAVCIWQAVTNSWQHLFAARFVLGLGIGPNSATVPVFAAECAPDAIRGGLVMMWQMWTAFGIMLGNVSDLAFYHVPDKSHVKGLNWRLMLASACAPALIIVTQVLFCPESPRWLVSKERYADAYKSLLHLRNSPIQAARDLYHLHLQQENVGKIKVRRNPFVELFAVPRNRRAAQASLLMMFMQQFCGINAIAYYSSDIFVQSGFSNTNALLASWGFGMLNWLGAFPAIYTIDRFGRRALLLTSYPLMALFLLLTGFSFFIPQGQEKARVGAIALGVYLYTLSYSPGAGPIPFTYSAEAYPQSVRDFGMSLSTSVLWFFNFVVAITFPPLIGAFKPQGAFAWYAAWNYFGFVMAFLFVPETKSLSLEELDHVFSVPSHEHAAYQLKSTTWRVAHMFSRRKEECPWPPPYKPGHKVHDHKGSIA